MMDEGGTLKAYQDKAAKVRKLAEDLRANEDKDFLIRFADEYERLAGKLPKT